MKRPEVDINGDLEQMYDYYDMPPNQYVTRAVHWVCGHALRPKISIEDDTRLAIQETLADSEHKRLVISANHFSKLDPFFVASAMWQLVELRPMIAETIIPSKTEYFNKPYTRWLWDAVGAKPVFREKDFSNDGIDQTELRRRAGELYIELAISRMVEDGEHLAGFFEGARNKNEPSTIQPIVNGIRRISQGLIEVGIEPVIFPLAIANSSGGIHRLTPKVRIGEPVIVRTPEDCDTLRVDMKDSLQSALDVIKNT